MSIKSIYLDYNATTPVNAEVVAAMQPYFGVKFGNSASAHGLGQVAAAAAERARLAVATLIGANPDEVVFTGSATEGNNQVIFDGASRGRVVTSAAEHSSVYEPCRYLAAQGREVDFLPVAPFGYPEIKEVKQSLSRDAALLSLLMANNETGILLPAIQELATLARSAGALFHVDATQAVGKIPVKVNELGVDLMSFSAHKIYGPKGIGALYVRRGCRIAPLLYGGGQENNRRAGTLNIPAIVGFGVAAKLATERQETDAAHLRACRDIFETALAKIPEVRIHGRDTARLPNTVSLSMPGSDAEKLALRLDQAGVAVSAGAACSNGRDGASRVLTAMGIPMLEAAGTIRISFGRQTTAEEVEQAAAILLRLLKLERGINRMSGVIDV